MSERVARGKTIAFVKVYETERLRKAIGDAGSFTGRLSGVLEGGEDFSILVKEGGIVAALLKGEPVSPAEIAKRISGASDGFIEVEILDDAGLNLELDYLKEARVKGAQEALDKFLESLERRAGEEAGRPGTPGHAAKGRAGAGVKAGATAGATRGEKPGAPVLDDKELLDSLARLKRLLRVNDRILGEMGALYSHRYEEVLRTIRAHSSVRLRVKPMSPRTLVNDLLLRLSDGSYLTVNAAYKDSELLLIIRGHAACLALERRASTTRAIKEEELAEYLVKTPTEYTIYKAPIEAIDKVMPPCTRAGGPRQAPGTPNHKAEEGLFRRLARRLRGR